MSDDFELRPVREDEFDAVLEVSSIAFGEELTPEDAAAWLPAFPFERSLAAFESGRMVATSAVLPLELTVPGGITIPMGGVTAISTLPTHRRRGLLARLLSAHFEDMTARGETVSGLGASEGVIYGRFGYGPAASAVSFAVEHAHSAFATHKSPSDTGRLTLLQGDQARTILPAIHESLRRLTPGTVSRASGLWHTYLADAPIERAGASGMLHVIHEDDSGRPDGYASYRVKEQCKGALSQNELKVVEVWAADATSYALLWRYLLDTDLVKTVTCAHGRVDEPLRWLLADPRRFVVNELYDVLWLRLHDVPRALADRRYATVGRLVLEVIETFPSPTVNRYELHVTSADSPAECAATTSKPDLALDAGTLSTTYLGGVSFAALAAAGRVRELTPGAVALADTMFLTVPAPFCSTDF
jgi:predicted acetyltransferase